MAGDPIPPARENDYRMARIGAASALVFVVTFLLLYDAVSPTYEVNGTVLVVLIVAVLSLLGLEANDVWKRRP